MPAFYSRGYYHQLGPLTGKPFTVCRACSMDFVNDLHITLLLLIAIFFYVLNLETKQITMYNYNMLDIYQNIMASAFRGVNAKYATFAQQTK